MSFQSPQGIEPPIIRAPMAWAQGRAPVVAVSVSEARSLGSLPCALLGLDAMRPGLVQGSLAGSIRRRSCGAMYGTPRIA
jgi:NAD(P)H-dependent flavin oxidoreductase YrpB (nitropropane dioxygenase family)